jgi:hypothetical protein
VIQDLQIDAGGRAGPRSGISIEGADQPGSQAHLDQIYSQADTSLFADSLNDLYIEKDNSFFGAGNVLVGGRLMQEGKGKARVSCNGGQFAGLSVKGNAVFLARDCWWEGSTRVPLNLSGAGRISIDGAMIAPGGADSLPTIRIGSFSGTISLMNMYVQGALWCEPANPALDLLVWNIHFYHKMNVLDFLAGNPRYRGAFLGLNAQCFRPNDPTCKQIISIPDQTVNVQDPNLFLDSATRADREDRPVPFTELPAGISNIYISRVAIGKMNRGIVFQ